MMCEPSTAADAIKIPGPSALNFEAQVECSSICCVIKSPMYVDWFFCNCNLKI